MLGIKHMIFRKHYKKCTYIKTNKKVKNVFYLKVCILHCRHFPVLF